MENYKRQQTEQIVNEKTPLVLAVLDGLSFKDAINILRKSEDELREKSKFVIDSE